MHTYMITRGDKDRVDEWITRLQGMWLDFPVMKDGTAGLSKGNNLFNFSIRPIQLWECVYPREQYDLVNNTLFLGSDQGKTQHSKHQKFLWMLQKALGANKMKPWKTDLHHPAGLFRQNVEAMAIGYKEDYNFPDGTEAL